MGKKYGFLKFVRKFSDFFGIWCVMKVYAICCILAQIPYLGKFWFLRYEPKCSWVIRLQDF